VRDARVTLIQSSKSASRGSTIPRITWTSCCGIRLVDGGMTTEIVRGTAGFNPSHQAAADPAITE
jgi:hypothetical protein